MALLGFPGLLGLSGGASGTGFAAPASANVVQPTTAGQANTAYNGAQNSLASQQALLAALQGQGGIGNQSQVYGQLQGVANGTGPNPAQAMLNQATGANVANQAALMAGQRGAGANVGLMARQAAQQGAATQQQAVGQGASMQAQQSLGALSAAGQMATQQAGQQIGATAANTQAQQAEQQALLNALSQQNAQNVQMQSNVNTANAGLAQTSMGGQQNLGGGLLQGLAGGLGGLGGGATSLLGPTGAATAGTAGDLMSVAPYALAANGGDISDAPQGDTPAPTDATAVATGPLSAWGKMLQGVSNSQTQQSSAAAGQAAGKTAPQPQQSALQKGGNALGSAMMSGVSSMMGARGGQVHDYRGGGKVQAKVPSEKAVAPGNNYSNDKVPALLSEHEIVIPRSVTMGKDPIANSAKFVAAEIAKRKTKRS